MVWGQTKKTPKRAFNLVRIRVVQVLTVTPVSALIYYNMAAIGVSIGLFSSVQSTHAYEMPREREAFRTEKSNRLETHKKLDDVTF